MTKHTKPYFDKEAADRAVFFIEKLKHTKGRWAGVGFKLLPWQKKIIRDLFGWKGKDGYRKYREAYIEVPKKNGKSELAAAVALYLLFADNEPGAEIYSAASDRGQAAIVFNVAAEMVRQEPNLKKRCKIIDSQKTIAVHKTNSFYRVLSSDVKTKHGVNAHGVIFDELHAQPNRDLFEVLTEGSGDARTQPLFFYITTAGSDRESICYEQHTRAEQVIERVVDDDSFYPVLYGLDDDADWEDEKNWKLSNPSLGHTIQIDRVRSAYRKAKANPRNENAFRRLRLNQWTETDTRWLPVDIWDACGGIIDRTKLVGRDCYAGLDLASNRDFASLVLAFPWEGEIFTGADYLFKFWLPEAMVKERVKMLPALGDWVRGGFVTEVPGNCIDPRSAYNEINDLRDYGYQIKEIGYDKWGATAIEQDLMADGFNIVPISQKMGGMGSPTKEFERMILQREVNHGGNPVARWMAKNVTMYTDTNGNFKPAKDKSGDNIDGIVAAIMATDRMIRHEAEQGPSVYETSSLI